MVPDLDHVIVSQHMSADRSAVYPRAVGGGEIFQKRIIRKGHNTRVLAAGNRTFNLDVIVRLAPEGHRLLVQRKLPDHRTRNTVNQFCHLLSSARKSRFQCYKIFRHRPHRPILPPDACAIEFTATAVNVTRALL